MTLEELARLVEALNRSSPRVDEMIHQVLMNREGVPRDRLGYTSSLDAVRSLGGLVVFASDIGADGLAMVKVVQDTSTSPVVEYTGIASRLEHAWLAAVIRSYDREIHGIKET